MNVYKFTVEANAQRDQFEVLVYALTFDVAMKKYLDKYPYEKYSIFAISLIAEPKEIIT